MRPAEPNCSCRSARVAELRLPRCVPVCLRMQVSGNLATKQRAFADYVIANFILHFAVLNFMG